MSDRSLPESFRIADEESVRRLHDRLAADIAARMPPDLCLIGIRRRGVPLAQALQERLQRGKNARVRLGEVTFKRYADDLSLLHESPERKEEEIAFDIEGADILLVNDVLYTGRTLFRATETMRARGAASVMTAVLCYRHETELPIQATFSALQLEVGPGHVVEVRTPPYDDELAVVISRRDGSS